MLRLCWRSPTTKAPEHIYVWAQLYRQDAHTLEQQPYLYLGEIAPYVANTTVRPPLKNTRRMYREANQIFGRQIAP
jgi:hypothetical protein